MKVSELINELEKLKKASGDVEVVKDFQDDEGWHPVDKVNIVNYNEELLITINHIN